MKQHIRKRKGKKITDNNLKNALKKGIILEHNKNNFCSEN